MRYLFAFIVVALFPCFGSANEITVGFGKDKPPFVFGRDAKGLEIDIFREALAEAGYNLKVLHFNNEALVEAVAMGRVDAVATARSDDPQLCKVERFVRFDNVAVSLQSQQLPIRDVEDLAGQRVVAWQGAYQDLGESFYRLFAPEHSRDDRRYLEHHSQEAQVKMFWLDRADVLIIDKVIFEWYRSQLPPNFQSQRPVQFHSVFSFPTYFPALFKDKTLCDQFRGGLEKLKASGRYEELYGSYIND